MPSSVEPYTSNSDSGGKSRDVLLLQRVAPGRGVGDHHAHRRAVVLRLHVVGQVADHADRRRCAERRGGVVRVDEAQPVLRVELVLQDDRLAHRERALHEPARPRVVQRTGRDVHVVEPVADELTERRSLPWIGRVAAKRPLRLARGAGRVDHRRRGPDHVALRWGRPPARRCRCDQIIAGLHARRGARRRTRRPTTPGGSRDGSGRTTRRTRRRRRPPWRHSDRRRRRPRRRTAGS